MTIPFGAQGVSAGLRGHATNKFSLPPGQTRLIPPGGWGYRSDLGYLSLQQLDPVMGIWVDCGDDTRTYRHINSDGVNFRVANTMGFPAGAVITTAGSGNTNGAGTAATGVTITPSAGNSVWAPVVGGAISTTITIVNGGTNYTEPPIIYIDAPPVGGVPATAVCASITTAGAVATTTGLSAGAIATVTVINQGAGYPTVPTVYVQPDARDTTGAGAILTAAAAASVSGTITAMLVADHGGGSPLTAVPTFTFAPTTGSPAATCIMSWNMVGYTGPIGSGGVAYGATGVTEITGACVPTAAPAGTAVSVLANPAIAGVAAVRMRKASIIPVVTAGVIQIGTNTNAAIVDGGIYQAVPLLQYITNSVSTTTVATYTALMGGLTDSFHLLAA